MNGSRPTAPKSKPTLRCGVTGHLCGTDTWQKGKGCICYYCIEFRVSAAVKAQKEKDAKIVDEIGSTIDAEQAAAAIRAGEEDGS